MPLPLPFVGFGVEGKPYELTGVGARRPGADPLLGERETGGGPKVPGVAGVLGGWEAVWYIGDDGGGPYELEGNPKPTELCGAGDMGGPVMAGELRYGEPATFGEPNAADMGVPA